MTQPSTIASKYRRLAALSWPKSVPVAQFPNPPLLVALAGWLVARITATGPVHDWATATNEIGIAAWAWLELSEGVNWFRRVLGAAALIWLAGKLASQFGA
jgi:hypothetical protein